MAKLNPAAAEALKAENQFLAGVQANIEDARGRHLRGSIWETVTDDDSDALRALMASKRMYDRSLLKELPQNRRVALRGYERWFVFWRRQTGAAIAASVSTFEDILDGEEPAPVGLNELVEHVRRVAPDPSVPHLIGLCSTSGFTEEARAARHDYPNVTLVLVEPTSGGGWRVTANEDVPQFVRDMFDPEDFEQKVRRVRRAVDQQRSDLLTGSLSAGQLSSRLELPRPVVERAMRQIAEQDSELRVSSSAGELLLYRGVSAMGKEKASMSFVDRIRELFAQEGDEAVKVNVLSERRAALAERRDRLYEDIGQLEEKEAELLRKGREAISPVVKRRLAAQLSQLRKDLARTNTTANMLNQQINIISTNIHNLTLIQQGEAASLPDSTELTENAVRAEEMLESLKADADLVAGLEAGVEDVLTGSDEREILAEFEEPSSAAPEAQAERPPRRAERQADKEEPAEGEPPAIEPERKPRRTDPEAT